MWRIGLVVIMLAGCGDDGVQDTPDADPATPDASARPDAQQGCEEVGPPWGGAYTISWECTDGCESDAPYQYFDELSIDGTVAVLGQSGCDTCDETVAISFEGTCFLGDGMPLGDGQASDPYQICADGCEARGTVSWTGYPGPLVQSDWLATVTR